MFTLGVVIASRQRASAGSTRLHPFDVSGDDGTVTVKIYPSSTTGFDGGTVKILFDRVLYKTIELKEGDKQFKQVVKVLDKGRHELNIRYASSGTYDRIWYEASLVNASVTKAPGTGTSLCPFFMGGLITILTILMAIGL
jgi:hypothetical protein